MIARRQPLQDFDRVEEQAAAFSQWPQQYDQAERIEIGKQMVRVRWLGPTQLSADDVCRAELLDEHGDFPDNAKATNFLRNYLEEGPRPAVDCIEAGNRECGFSFTANWWRHKILLGNLKGTARKRGFKDGWYWILPGQTLESR